MRTAVAFDVAAVRARFPALARPTALLDGPGGTQVPDSVIEAMTSYLREVNANVGGPFPTSRKTDAVVGGARAAAARFLGCSPDEVGFGQNMTTLNFTLSRALGRELRAGDEIVVTRLDHDANVSPWLELAPTSSSRSASPTSTTTRRSTSTTSSGSSPSGLEWSPSRGPRTRWGR